MVTIDDQVGLERVIDFLLNITIDLQKKLLKTIILLWKRNIWSLLALHNDN